MSNMTEGKFEFVWKIENFSSCCLKQGNFLDSPEFTAESINGSKWYIRIYPHEFSPPNKVISAFLHRSNKCDFNGKVKIYYDMAFILPNDQVFRKESNQQKEFKKGEFGGWCHVLKTDAFVKAMSICTEDVLILSCNLMKDMMVCEPFQKCEVKTRIGKDECCFEWQVKRPSTSEWIENKVSPFQDICPIRITLKSQEESISFQISFTNKELQFPKSVTCTLAAIDGKGFKKRLKKDYRLFLTDEIWEFHCFRASDICGVKETFSRDEILSFMCKISISNGKNWTEVMKYESISQERSPKTNAVWNLQNDLRKVLLDEKYSDVKIKVCGELHSAHWLILATRSPVFAAMFEHKMAETHTGVVEIDDIDTGTLQLFLKFLYTGETGVLDYENASKLLLVAEKYQVASLKDVCSCTLTSLLTVENVCEILRLSDLIGHQLLKDSSLEYIQKHPKEVLSSEGWNNLTEKTYKLVSEVLVQILV